MDSARCMCLAFLACQLALSEGAEEAGDEHALLETVTIVGSREATHGVAGAANFIDEEQLAKFAHADVQRILRQVPGLSIQL